MWQRVLPSNLNVVQAAFRVLAAHGDNWYSANDLKHWLELHDDHVFFFSSEAYQLVVGFREDPHGQLRGTLAGISGDLSIPAVRELISKGAAVARERNARTIAIHLRKLRPSSPFALFYTVAIGIARSDPSIANVTEHDKGKFREYVFTLRQQAA